MATITHSVVEVRHRGDPRSTVHNATDRPVKMLIQNHSYGRGCSAIDMLRLVAQVSMPPDGNGPCVA
jgi:hypothetical protein